jgi:hypothetical protein
VIHERGYLGVRVDSHKAAAELIAVDPDQPGIVFRTAVAKRQQFFQHYRDLHPVRRGQRIKL